MKVLFTADWHIKLGQKNVPVEWQKNRYRMLFRKIADLQPTVDLIIIGGDIFDKLPSLEELELYFWFLPLISTETIIYDGNHEATKRGHTFLTKLTHATEAINPKVQILDGPSKIFNMDFIPYTHIKEIEKDNSKRLHILDYSSILCTHVRGEIPPHVKPEIDLELLDKWEVVLAGDLHAYENSQRNILYPGSPLSTSFHRSPVTNGVIRFDTETLEHEFIPLGLPQLIRKTVESQAEAIPTDYDHTIYEITGNVLELAGVDTTATHIDKKVVQKNTEKTLDLENKTISGELVEYLTQIQKIDKKDIEDILKVYHDYVEDD